MPITPKTLDFLIENRLHDSKEWFHSHKKEYEELVLRPLQELVEAMAPAMLQIDEQIVAEPKVTRSISRIYRDTRFTKDKSLYRENMWLTFMRNKKLYHSLPGFFFDFSANHILYGCGYYQADTESMTQYRSMILNREQPFLDALHALREQDIFRLDGDMYKRTRFPGEPEEIRQWLDRKNIDFTCETMDYDTLFSDQLPQILNKHFQLLKPMYEFLMAVESRCVREENQRR